MPHLSLEDKAFFKANGYLIKHGLLTDEMIRQAQDALWSGIQADRDDPQTWINAGPRVPVPGKHPAILATLYDTPVFDITEEMVGKDQLNRSGGPGPHLVYPSGDSEWALPKRGHLDGYYTPTNGVPQGTVMISQICVTIYVDRVDPRGAGFTLWPGSHRTAAAYLRTRSLLSLGPVPGDDFPLAPPLEVTGPAGTVCFWHGQLVHSGSKNVNRNIRMALIGRLTRKDVSDILFESPDDMWEYWEGLKGCN